MGKAKKKMGKKANQNSYEAYQSFPLADTGRVDGASGVTVPTETGVREAKEWVDFNEK